MKKSGAETITIVGAGALGSHVVLFLRSLEEHIRVIDHDRIEQKNVLAQFHGKIGVGKNKAQALEQSMNFLFGVKLTTFPRKLTQDNEVQLLGGSDLILDCLDNAEARRIVQNFARKNNIACLHGALAANGEFGRVVWDEYFVIDEGGEGVATCEGGEHLPFIAMVSAHLARAAQVWVESRKKIGFNIYPSNASIRI